MKSFDITSITPTIEALSRFYQSFRINNNQSFNGLPCWDWQLSPNKGGYGRFQFNKMRIHAHRWAYLAFIGITDSDDVVDHLCRRRICVNPAHMEPIAFGDNIRRGESIPAQHARATECINGHSLAPENLINLTTSKSRRCKICHREKVKRARRKRAELKRQSVDPCAPLLANHLPLDE